MAKKKEEYGNESIKSLKGADRVRKRRPLSLALTVWKAVPIPFLRSYPTPSTKRVTATATKSTLPFTRITLWK